MAVYQSMKDNLIIHCYTLLETLELDPVADRLLVQEILTRDRLNVINSVSQIPMYRNLAFLKYMTELNEESLNTFISALEDTGQKHLAVLITGYLNSVLILQD